MRDNLNVGAPLPPRGQTRWYTVVSPVRGQPLRAILLADTFYGRWTHHVPPTLPCAETEDCHWCRSGLGPRYNGYIAALIGTPAQMRVLALTYLGCCQLVAIIKKRGTSRGLDVTLYRKFLSPRAPIMIRVEREIPADQLPPSFDVLDSLTKLWGVNREFLERGCRRIGEKETVAEYLRKEMERKAKPKADDVPPGEVA